MSDNIVSESSSWPAWKVTLAIGVPVAIVGVGFYYYTSKKDASVKQQTQKNSISRTEPEGSSSPRKEAAVGKNSDISGASEVHKKTPLEEAQDMKNVGNRLFKQGQYNEAIKKYAEAIKVCPNSHKTEKSTYHQNMAAAMEKLENWEGVVRECTVAIQLNQRYVKALCRRAKAYDKLGKKENSLEDITTVCILEGFQNHANMMFADEMLKQIGKEKAAKKYKNRQPVMPSHLFIKQYFASFNDDLISQRLTEEQASEASYSGYIRAKLALQNGTYSYVIPECTGELDNLEKPQEPGKSVQVQDENSYEAEALLLRGTFYLLTGNSSDAKEDLNRVIHMKDAHIKLKANALIKRGSMNMQLQEAEKAREDFTFAVDVDPNNCDVYHHRGQLHILLDKVAEALADFDKCIELKPDFAMAHAQRCYTMYRQSFNSKDIIQTQEAMDQFQNIINQYPTCSETYGLFAQAQTDNGKYDKADELFQRAIEIEPDNATLYVHRGLLALQWKQDLDQAVRLISKALEVDDKCDFAHETMGTIEVQRGNLEKASEHFDVAIEYAKTEIEMAHLFALKAAAIAQGNIAKKYGLRPPGSTNFM